MITNLKVRGFKSLSDVTLRLGGLNLFVGTNASGKSNFFDALRVLQGIGYGFTIEEILNGKPKGASSEVWEPIRGGSGRAAFSGLAPVLGTPVISFEVTLVQEARIVQYEIGFAPLLGTVRTERFILNGTEIFSSAPIANSESSPVFEVRYYTGNRGRQPHFQFERSRPILHQIQQSRGVQENHLDAMKACAREISNTQRVDPAPSLLREYSKASLVTRMGERGENFAALVKAILADPTNKEAYLSWLRQLTPVELDDVRVLSGALGEPLFALSERGADYPAQILSDGTLRFAAIAAAFFQPEMPGILTIEEIENGIHPSRLRLLVELLRSQSSKGTLQVMATTHSPIVLAWLNEHDFETTFFCRRDEVSGASVITPLDQVPRFAEIVSRQPIGELFAEGWLEAAQ